MVVVDAYEERQGRLVVKLGGALPVVDSRGPEFDMGELQRYLGYAGLCPPMLVRNQRLVWTVVGPRTLRVSDADDRTGATMDYEIGEGGCPIRACADRPRAVGKKTVLTPWSATALDFCERDGMRVATRLQAAWLLPEGSFTYFRGEVTSYCAER